MHESSGLHGEPLIDGDDDQVVEYAFGGHVHVDDLRELGSHERQEDALGCFSHIEILLRRLADNSGQVNRVLSVCDRRDMKDWIIAILRVVARMITKWTF